MNNFKKNIYRSSQVISGNLFVVNYGIDCTTACGTPPPPVGIPLFFQLPYHDECTRNRIVISDNTQGFDIYDQINTDANVTAIQLVPGNTITFHMFGYNDSGIGGMAGYIDVSSDVNGSLISVPGNTTVPGQADLEIYGTFTAPMTGTVTVDGGINI